MAEIFYSLANGTTQVLRHQVAHTFRSLKHRNYRLYFFGQLISLCGTWMQNLAVSWLVYRLSRSPWMLGLVSFASLAPTLVFGLAGGWCADRFERKKIVLMTQTLAMVQAAVLATLMLTKQIQVWQILLLTAILGTANSFEMPARQALIANMVAREDLVNAVSLNASLFNGTRMVGPAIAGFLVTFFGEGICFALNSASYLAAVAAIALIRTDKDGAEKEMASRASSIAQAIRFVIGAPSVLKVLILVMVLSLFGMQYLMLLPVIASKVLHGSAFTLGALMAAGGFGSLIAALALASLSDGSHLKHFVGYALLSFSTGLLMFSFCQNFYLSCLIIMMVAFGMTLQLSMSHSFIQLSVPDHLRGKVMSIYMMVFMGGGPIGSLFAGATARAIGAPTTIFLCACICAFAAIIYLLSGSKNLLSRTTCPG